MTSTVASAMTCLGCGCTCDDIELTIETGRITRAERACEAGTRWFGDGRLPARTLVAGQDTNVGTALAHAAILLRAASRPQVLLGPDLTSEAYREAIGCADLLKARVDICVEASPVTLAVQEQGIATATLGEVRNRADLIVYWGVDPDQAFPRFRERYAPGIPPDAGSTARRSIVAVDIDEGRGPRDADARISLPSAEVSNTLIALTALLQDSTRIDPHAWPLAADVAGHVNRARYTVFVADATNPSRLPPDATRRLLALGHALNARSRGAPCLLRQRGNRAGAEAALTRQTGYPDSVDFASGTPRYRPLQAMSGPPPDVTLGLGTLGPAHPTAPLDRTILIGPGASTSALAQAAVVIDTGKAGIHSSGTVVRMDDVPLPVRAVAGGVHDAEAIVASLKRHLMESRA